MAIGTPVARGTAVSGASSSSLALTPTGTLIVGHAAILAIEGDNIAAGDLVTSVTDTGGNVWEKLHEYTNAGGGAALGVTVSVWRSHLTTQLTTGSTITANFASAIVDKCAGLIDVPITAGNHLVNGATPVDTPISAANGFGSAVFSALASLQRLYLRICGKEGNSTATLTPTTNFTNSAWAVRSRNNTLAQMLRAEWRVNTSTGETSNPSLAISGDAASTFFALIEELPTRSAVVSQTLDVFGLVASGTVLALATAAQTMPDFTQVATATVTAVRDAVVNQTLPPFTQATSGGPVSAASASQALPVFTQATTGGPIPRASASQTLGTFGLGASGQAIVAASASQSMPAFALVASGQAIPGATVLQTIPAFVQTVNGQAIPAANVAQTLPDFTQIATATVSDPERFASVDAPLAPFTGDPVGIATVRADVSVPLGTFAQVFTGYVEQPRQVVDPVIVVVAPVKLISRYDRRQLEGDTWDT